MRGVFCFVNIIELIEQIKWIPSIHVTFIDIAQMVIITFVLWYLAKTLYRTRAWILVKGLLVLGVIYLLICLTDMKVLQIIMQGLFSSLMIAIVIMLQPELQKIVEIIGKKRLVDIKTLLLKKTETATWYSLRTIYEIITACETMSAAKTGALIAIERGIPLKEYANSGIKLGSDVSSQLLINIFEKNTPLHDGAVIVSNDKIDSATCYLPLSMNYSIDKVLGTRHRAAIGISETTDCMVIVVSEETGAISLCVDGNIQHNINRLELADALKKSMRKSEDKTIGKRRSKTPIWIKACAPILSVVIWLSVVSASDPVVTKIINDVPVVTINTEALDVVGHTYTIQSGDTIDVRVEGRRSLVDGMTSNDLCATADFSQMSIVYSVPIDVATTDGYSDVKVVEANHTMKLAIENMVQTEIDVEVKIIGDTNNEHVVHLKDLEMQTLKITCPQSIAKTLDIALITIDAYGKTNHFISTIEPIIYDKNGDVVPNNKLTLNKESIRVMVDVYTVKEIPINVQLSQQDMKAESYYVLNDYTAESPTIRVAIDDDAGVVLNTLNVVVSPDSYDKNTNYILVNLQSHLPNGVYLAKDQELQMAVKLDLTQYKKITIGLPWDQIQLSGYDTDLMIATIIDAPTTITLYYNADLMSESMIVLETLRPVVKITTKDDGTYRATISVTDIDGVNITTDLSVTYMLETNEKGEHHDDQQQQ